MRAREFVERFEQFAPKSWAEPWDVPGLQLGDLDAPIHKILVTLDVRPETVAEAIKVGADFIFAHHPAMFHPAKTLDLQVPQNQMYATILAHHITVYAAHTNLDSAPGGMNDWLAAALGLTHCTGLVPSNGREATSAIMMGRIGNLPTPTTVRRVAILGGSGSEFYPAALAQHADVYVTGDVSYHPAQDMLAAGLSVVDPGHHIESICIPQLTKLFTTWQTENNWDLTIQPSAINTEPFTFMM